VSTLRVANAFFVREARIELSYKSGFALKVGAGLMSVALFYFVARFVRNVAPTTFQEYGGYFSFVVVGLAVSAYMARGIGAIATAMRGYQAFGALEIMILSPTRLPTLLLSASFPAYVLGLVTLLAFLVAGAALGADLGGADVPAALVLLLVAIPSFVALGLFAAALVFVTRRGNPVAWAIRAVSVLLCGVLYPVAVLPGWLQPLSEAIPLTHAVEAARNTLLLGDGLGDVWPQLLALLALTAIYLPLGLLLCAWGLRVARTDGSLTR
jgi:ABC-2 type transport system permease protein